MARVKLAKPDQVDDPAVAGIFEWVMEMEGSVPALSPVRSYVGD